MIDNVIPISKKTKGGKKGKNNSNQNSKQNQNNQVYWVKNEKTPDELETNKIDNNNSHLLNDEEKFPGYSNFENGNTNPGTAWQEDNKGLENNITHLAQLYPEADYDIIRSVLLNFNNSLENAEFQLNEMFIKPSFFAQAEPELPIEPISDTQKGNRNKKDKIKIISNNRNKNEQYDSEKPIDYLIHEEGFDTNETNYELGAEFQESDNKMSKKNSSNKKNKQKKIDNDGMVDEYEIMKEMEKYMDALNNEGFFYPFSMIFRRDKIFS